MWALPYMETPGVKTVRLSFSTEDFGDYRFCIHKQTVERKWGTEIKVGLLRFMRDLHPDLVITLVEKKSGSG